MVTHTLDGDTHFGWGHALWMVTRTLRLPHRSSLQKPERQLWFEHPLGAANIGVCLVETKVTAEYSNVTFSRKFIKLAQPLDYILGYQDMESCRKEIPLRWDYRQ